MMARWQSILAWLGHHGPALQAAMGVLTVLLALAALVGVKVQIDSSRQLQQEQSARDIYREFLNLSVSRPDLAVPDACTPMSRQARVSYDHYVDYMLYTTEQLLEASPDWESTALDHFDAHGPRLCAMRALASYPPAVVGLIRRFQADACPVTPPACAETRATAAGSR